MDQPPSPGGGGGGLGDRLVFALMWLGAFAVLVGVAVIVWGAVR